MKQDIVRKHVEGIYHRNLPIIEAIESAFFLTLIDIDYTKPYDFFLHIFYITFTIGNSTFSHIRA